MKKYDKIKRLGHRATDGIFEHGNIYIQEKMDGANFRFMLHDDTGQLLFGSRNVEYKENGTPLHHSDIGGNFSRVSRHCTENIDTEAVTEIEAEQDSKLVFFGENMVKHTLDYNWEEIPPFLGFDVYHVEDEHFLPKDEADAIFERLGLETAPHIEVVDSRKELRDYEIPNSKWRDGTAEGVVLKNYEQQIFAKLRSESFKERHEKTFGKGQKQSEDDTERIVAKYCTNARIEKHIKKMTVDEGQELEMRLMEDLPMGIVEDIWQEEYEELVRMNYTIDMKRFRSLIAQRCVQVLKMEIRNRALNDEQTAEAAQ